MTHERLEEILQAALQKKAGAEALEILELAAWAIREKAAAKRRLDSHRTRLRAERVPKKRGRPVIAPWNDLGILRGGDA